MDEQYLVAGILTVLCMGIIGAAIGSTKQNAGMGLILGMFLGPIGWLIVLLLPGHGRKCPECLGEVPQGASRCKHCGSKLSRDPALQRTADHLYYVHQSDQVQGPFSRDQIRMLLNQGTITVETQCAKASAKDHWFPVGMLINE